MAGADTSWALVRRKDQSCPAVVAAAFHPCPDQLKLETPHLEGDIEVLAVPH